MWSIGVLAYILLSGCPPFNGDTDAQIFNQVKSGIYTFDAPQWDDVSCVAKDFICCLLRMDPSERLTASEALAHPWIASRSNKIKSRQRSMCGPRDFNFAVCQRAWSTLIDGILSPVTLT
jgi:calcium/calmodulin-dependent protein kinase I